MTFAFAADVRRALDAGAPVVALETSIVTHGMPWPENLATARGVEALVRDGGATPATIALLGGRVHVGVDDAALERLAATRDVRKVSRADLGFAVAAAVDGATTVAATMLLAHRAGISVVATGGIGGVHRGAERSFDISADLDEFGRSPVSVVCAGAKALLDLPKTLEALETRGVPVVGYRTGEFPAFWSRASGLPLTLRCETVTELAGAVLAQRRLTPEDGLLIVNPIPPEAEIPAAEMARHVDAAVAAANAHGIAGKALTPFLLEELRVRTDGRSLTANIALVRNNARLAAALACELAGKG